MPGVVYITWSVSARHRIVADDAKLEIAVEEVAGDLARKAAPDLHFHFGVERTVLLDVAAAGRGRSISLAPMVRMPAELSRSSARNSP